MIPVSAQSVEMGLPALQAQVAQAHYRVEVETDESDDAFRRRLADFMARPEAWREQRRKGKDTVRYDLRPLVLELNLHRTSGDRPVVRSVDEQRAGRDRPAR